MENSKKEILCIDDDRDTCELVEFMFKQKDYQVTSCMTAEEGLIFARENRYGAIILDNRFKGIGGANVCREIRSFDTVTPSIFFSGDTRRDEVEKGLAAGANAYLIKPNDLERLTDTVINLSISIN